MKKIIVDCPVHRTYKTTDKCPDCRWYQYKLEKIDFNDKEWWVDYELIDSDMIKDFINSLLSEMLDNE